MCVSLWKRWGSGTGAHPQYVPVEVCSQDQFSLSILRVPGIKPWGIDQPWQQPPLHTGPLFSFWNKVLVSFLDCPWTHESSTPLPLSSWDYLLCCRAGNMVLICILWQVMALDVSLCFFTMHICMSLEPCIDCFILPPWGFEIKPRTLHVQAQIWLLNCILRHLVVSITTLWGSLYRLAASPANWLQVLCWVWFWIS